MKRKKTDIVNIPLEMILLSMLSKEDMYGSQMVKKINLLTDGKLSIFLGSMYPILYRLTDEECVEFYEKAVGRRLTVVYYHITDKGRERLADLKKKFFEQISVVEKLIKD